MTPEDLKRLKLENLRDHSPRTFKRLSHSGDLAEYLDLTANAAHQELCSLREGGYTAQEAWEIVRSEFLKPLDEEGDSGSDDGNENELLTALNEGIDAANRAWTQSSRGPTDPE